MVGVTSGQTCLRDRCQEMVARLEVGEDKNRANHEGAVLS
jgi:hypothetical protein